MKSLSRVWLFGTPWTSAYQTPPSMGFSKREYCSGLLFPSPGDLPNPGIEPRSPTCRQTLYRLSHQGSSFLWMGKTKTSFKFFILVSPRFLPHYNYLKNHKYHNLPFPQTTFSAGIFKKLLRFKYVLVGWISELIFLNNGNKTISTSQE